MDPKLAQRLMQIPEMAEFVKWLDEEAAKLDRASDIEVKDPTLLAIEVQARRLAHQKLLDIIAPLVGAQVAPSQTNNKEYAVDVEDLPS